MKIIEAVFTHIEELQNYEVIYHSVAIESNPLEILIRKLLILMTHLNLNINVNLRNLTLQQQLELIIERIMAFNPILKILFLIDDFNLRNNDFLNDIFFLSEYFYQNIRIKLIIASSDDLPERLRDGFISIYLE